MMAMKTSKLTCGGLGYRSEISRYSTHASTPSGRRDQLSESGSQKDVLNLTPRQSFSSNSNAEELLREIAAIELEIVHLERHILSLYRATFSQYLVNSVSPADLNSNSKFQAEVTLKGGQSRQKFPANIINFKGSSIDSGDETVICSDVKCRSSSSVSSSTFSIGTFPPSEVFDNPLVKAAPCHLTLADHLCTSLREKILGTPCKLSEDIIKCISAVYCKLNTKAAQMDYSSSPVSSLSSSTMFSPPDKSETWSPRYYYEPTASPSQLEMLKEKNYPSNGMLQITKITIDKDRFKCAAALLEGHRQLVHRLKSVDPIKLSHQEKLAFWLNIHNAMVMHAFIADAFENSHLRFTPSVLKKSYNVGGVNFNACEIQTFILGCRPHCPDVNIRPLVRRKLNTANGKHACALDRPEPLVHFALCLGAYSDPSVRVYTAKNVTRQLQAAKEEFIQSNLYIHREGRVVLPKILETYAKDASLPDTSVVLDMVHDCLPEAQQEALRRCIKGKQRKCIEWSSYNSSFRFVLHGDLNPDKQ